MATITGYLEPPDKGDLLITLARHEQPCLVTLCWPNDPAQEHPCLCVLIDWSHDAPRAEYVLAVPDYRTMWFKCPTEVPATFVRFRVLQEPT